MKILNGITNIVFTTGMIITGVPFPVTWKLLDYSQLFSLYYFSDAPNFDKHKDLLESLRLDNYAPMFRNFLGWSLYLKTNDGSSQFLDVEK